MPSIDIDSLTEHELRDLHYRITERLRVLAQLRAHQAMMQLAIGDRVEFHADGRLVAGVIPRYNRKTVTVIADGGGRWNVSPGLLTRAAGPAVVPNEPNRLLPAGVLARVGRIAGGGR